MTDAVLLWEAGERLEELELPPITRSQLARYAAASGDLNPIHTSDQAAEEAGLPGVIAHGMLVAAFVGRLFSPYLGHGYVTDLDARFSGMVFVGDVLVVGGRATGAGETREGRIYSFEVYARRGDEMVVTGKAGFLAYGAP